MHANYSIESRIVFVWGPGLWTGGNGEKEGGIKVGMRREC